MSKRLTDMIKYIESFIDYEEEKGLHTFTMCDCGRQGFRQLKCALCWKDDLKEVNKKLEEYNIRKEKRLNKK